jgi:hypothetical protein
VDGFSGDLLGIIGRCGGSWKERERGVGMLIRAQVAVLRRVEI